MNNLLIFFALPVATIILAIVLQKIIRNPLLVAATFFAIYLIVTFSAFDASFLVYAILYTILAYVTAILTRTVCRLLEISSNDNCNYTVSQSPIAVSNCVGTSNILSNENTVLSANNLNNALSDTFNAANFNSGCNYNRYRRR